jgi:hypothetical protein
VFHSPQFGHFPTQRADSQAQDWQTYRECILSLIIVQYTDDRRDLQPDIDSAGGCDYISKQIHHFGNLIVDTTAPLLFSPAYRF